MKLENKTILVTGASRGIGKAIVVALLKYPVKKIYASARNITDVQQFSDSRVVPISLDITDQEQTQQAVQRAQDVDVLINNAGVLAFAGIVSGGFDLLKRDMEVNYFGTLNMIRSVLIRLIHQTTTGSV